MRKNVNNSILNVRLEKIKQCHRKMFREIKTYIHTDGQTSLSYKHSTNSMKGNEIAFNILIVYIFEEIFSE